MKKIDILELTNKSKDAAITEALLKINEIVDWINDKRD